MLQSRPFGFLVKSVVANYVAHCLKCLWFRFTLFWKSGVLTQPVLI